MAEDRRQRKKAETKETIYNAALELFLTKGYDETTIEEITEKADVAKGTFFNHFPSKDSIISYLGQKRLVLLDTVIKDELRGIQSAKEKLFELFRILARLNEKEKDITRLTVREYFTRAYVTPQLVEQEKNTSVGFRAVLGNIIEEGKTLGEFRCNVNADHVADILVGIYYFTLFPWLEGKLSNSLTHELLVRIEVIMTGIES